MGSIARNLLKVQYQVMLALTDEDPTGVLEAIGTGFGFDVGTFWEVDPDQVVLIPRATWARDDGDAAEFRSITRTLRFPRGEGGPGMAWASREVRWFAPFPADARGPRGDAVRAAKLSAGLWLPVLSTDDVFGVVELMRRSDEPLDPDLFEGLRTIGRAIGLYLRRIRAEHALAAGLERQIEDRTRQLRASEVELEAVNRELESRVALGTRALVESERLLRALAERIQTIREDERAVLAREIHDVLGQELTGLKMDAGWISRRLAERSDPDDSIAARMQAMIGNIDATSGAVRRISAALRPRVLDDLGLVAAAECLARELAQRSSMEVELVTPDELPLPAPLATAVYRILQELLTNVVRHAEARRIQIDIALDGGAVELRVLDDGKGFQPRADRSSETPSLGLIGIRERARTFGGALAIGSRPGGGTEATVRIPIDCGARP